MTVGWIGFAITIWLLCGFWAGGISDAYHPSTDQETKDAGWFFCMFFGPLALIIIVPEWLKNEVSPSSD